MFKTPHLYTNQNQRVIRCNWLEKLIKSKTFKSRQLLGSVLQNQREVSQMSLVGSTPTRFRQFFQQIREKRKKGHPDTPWKS